MDTKVLACGICEPLARESAFEDDDCDHPVEYVD